METERLRIFDEQYNEIGSLPRKEVHKQGHWHETFHCWFVRRESDQTYLTLQLRSKLKKDFPNLLDITAAGHLLETESVQDGVREIEEEIGIKVNISDLIPVGRIKNELILNQFIDREFCHVYLYVTSLENDQYTLQEEEVSGMFHARLEDLQALYKGKIPEIEVEGFTVAEDGSRSKGVIAVSKESLVPHGDQYMQTLFKAVEALSFED